MKTETTPQLGILDALTAGLNTAIKRPWLIAIPAVVDLALWLMPRLAIDHLLQRLLAVWEAFFRLGVNMNPLGTADMVTTVREGITQLGQGLNLAEAVTGGWLSVPSAVATIQTSRLMFVSDDVMAPVGMGLQLPRLAPSPWRVSAIEINSFWGALLIGLGLWLAGQLIMAFFLRWAASGAVRANGQSQGNDPKDGTVTPIKPWAGVGGLLSLMARLIAFTVLLGTVVFVLYIPLGLAMIIVASATNAATGLLFAVTGGMTLWLLLWLLTSVFFVSEAMVLEGKPLWQSLRQSFSLARQNSLRTISMVIIINLILLGFRAVWGFLGQTPVGAVVSIIGNAYLVTAMLLAVYVYYGELRRRAQAAAAARSQGQMINKG